VYHKTGSFGQPDSRVPAALAALFLLSLAPPSALAQARIVGRVEHVGFPAGSSHCYRPGTWCSAIVRLRNEGNAPVSGRLVLRQRDKDGDVTVAETVVALTPDGLERTYRIDFLAGQPSAAGVFSVILQDEQNRPVPIYEGSTRHEGLPAPIVTPVPDGTALLLDLSARPIPGLNKLADRSSTVLRDPLVVSGMPPACLPDRGYVLQGVQAILWDAPDLSRLQPQQTQALIDYVRAGGVLVIAAGRSAESIAKSPLGKILPATVSGTTTADVLQNTWTTILKTKGESNAPMYLPPITLARARKKPHCTVVSGQDDLKVDVVTRGVCGSGVVVFIAADLRDLFQQGGDAVRFFEEVIGLLDNPDPKFQGGSTSPSYDPYKPLQELIGFESLGGSFLVFVVLFVAAYILLSTLGVWAWLRRRAALQQSWVAFAGMAAACSVLSIGFVQVLRGVGTDLRQVCIVDVTLPVDGTPARTGQAYAWFGLKTGLHTRLDLRLESRPGDEVDTSTAYLRPLAPDPQRQERSFVAPETYALRTGQAAILGVPIRATLKRMEGCWRGHLEGSFSASVQTDAQGVIQPGSWVRNDLGFDLHDCSLVCPTTWRMGGMQRATSIFVHQVAGTLRSGQGRIPIDTVQAANPSEWYKLSEIQERWAAPFMPFGGAGRGLRQEQPKFTLDQFQTSLMLLTTLGEYTHTADGRPVRPALERAFSRDIDRCHLLTKGTLILIGFADVPGPVRLAIRPAGDEAAVWRPIDPEMSRTMFRFILPVRGATGTEEASL
jgi:hypothetical protein